MTIDVGLLVYLQQSMRSHFHHIKALLTLIAIFVLLIIGNRLVGDIGVPTIPPPTPPAPIITRDEITHGDTTKRQVIFTFDGGGSAVSTDGILATLAKHHIKGTFFLTGKFVEKYPDKVKAIAAGGHEIFSHTYDHPHLTEVSDAQVADELQKMESVLQATVGISPKPFFRPPYGDRDQRVLDIAYKEGYESVYWSADARDWEEPKGMTAAEVKSNILNNMNPGAIYLMHLGDTITGSILDDVFTAIESRGYKVVSLTQGL